MVGEENAFLQCLGETNIGAVSQLVTAWCSVVCTLPGALYVLRLLLRVVYSVSPLRFRGRYVPDTIYCAGFWVLVFCPVMFFGFVVSFRIGI